MLHEKEVFLKARALPPKLIINFAYESYLTFKGFLWVVAVPLVGGLWSKTRTDHTQAILRAGLPEPTVWAFLHLKGLSSAPQGWLPLARITLNSSTRREVREFQESGASQ
ncbi:hypothetical protein [Nocardiopsis valliformis]|uniref:hypothetical protein n=1 Tax=Nocardiopsis valliformis TaxID=239974 RepID=UPI000382A327|nr:hypothetical protein [Nocardiopsis valliformis]